MGALRVVVRLILWVLGLGVIGAVVIAASFGYANYVADSASIDGTAQDPAAADEATIWFVVWLVVVVVTLMSAALVAFDAGQLGARRGVLGGGFLDMGPAGWFFSCVFFGWFGVVAYIANRPQLRRAQRSRSTHPPATQPGTDRFCTHCGVAATPGGTYCSGCGNLLPASSPPPRWYG